MRTVPNPTDIARPSLATQPPEGALADEFRELESLRSALALDHIGQRFETPLGPVEIWQDRWGRRVIISNGRELRVA